MNRYGLKKSLSHVKGMIFAGCSFTWGQGLYYYSRSPSLTESSQYNINLVKEPHLSYMYSVRFPRLVANHFNTYEMVQPWNGGSHDKILNWWGQALSMPIDAFSESYKDPAWSQLQKLVWPISFKDASYVIFQMTQPHRCNIVLHENQTEEISYIDCLTNTAHYHHWQKWLEGNNLTETQFETYYKNKSINKVKKFLQEVEKNGVKTIVMTWPEQNVPFIKNDEWLSSRFLNLSYNGTTYDSMEEMMKNPKMTIMTDYENFSRPPQDKHPSMLCHSVVADNIINYIEQHNYV